MGRMGQSCFGFDSDFVLTRMLMTISSFSLSNGNGARRNGRSKRIIRRTRKRRKRRHPRPVYDATKEATERTQKAKTIFSNVFMPPDASKRTAASQLHTLPWRIATGTDPGRRPVQPDQAAAMLGFERNAEPGRNAEALPFASRRPAVPGRSVLGWFWRGSAPHPDTAPVALRGAGPAPGGAGNPKQSYSRPADGPTSTRSGLLGLCVRRRLCVCKTPAPVRSMGAPFRRERRATRAFPSRCPARRRTRSGGRRRRAGRGRGRGSRAARCRCS